MKKTVILFSVVLIVLSLLSGCQRSYVEDEATGTTTSTSSDDVATGTTTSTSSDDVVDTDAVRESLTDKLIREIDGAYKEESKRGENSTTAGMVDLADKYTKNWQQVADEYYNKIMEYDGIIQLNENYYSSDDLHTFVSNMKSNWEQYYQVQCENYNKTLQTIYSGGTIVGPILANYKYEMQKEWALQIVRIYNQLY